MLCEEIRDLLPAHADREIGVPEAVDIERHLQTCMRCQMELAKELALRATLKNDVTYFHAPDYLKERIKAALPSSAPVSRDSRAGGYLWSRWNVAAAMVSIVAIVWSVSLYLTLPSASERLVDEMVSNHVRALLSTHKVDVLSSDRHTVKPWFSGKLDYSLPVFDLTPAGFPLVGGRLDYLNHRQVAALVYRHHEHTINLFVVPTINDRNPPTHLSRQGYHLVHWKRSKMDFWAVSDVDSEQLVKFKEAFNLAQVPSNRSL